jgi:hypothetical protein
MDIGCSILTVSSTVFPSIASLTDANRSSSHVVYIFSRNTLLVTSAALLLKARLWDHSEAECKADRLYGSLFNE